MSVSEDRDSVCMYVCQNYSREDVLYKVKYIVQSIIYYTKVLYILQSIIYSTKSNIFHKFKYNVQTKIYYQPKCISQLKYDLETKIRCTT